MVLQYLINSFSGFLNFIVYIIAELSNTKLKVPIKIISFRIPSFIGTATLSGGFARDARLWVDKVLPQSVYIM